MRPSDNYLLQSPPEDDKYNRWLDSLILEAVIEITAEKIIGEMWHERSDRLMDVLAAHYDREERFGRE